MCCWEEEPSWECPDVHRQAALSSANFLNEKWPGEELAERQVGKKLKEKNDVMDPTPLLSQVYVGCTQRDSMTTESNVKTKSDFIGKITTTRTEAKSQIKGPAQKNVASWSNDSEGDAEK